MPEKYTTVYGVYRSRAQMHEAMDALKQAGFEDSNLSICAAVPGKRRRSRETFVPPQTETALEGVLGTAARITGGVLGVGSVVAAAPLAFILTGVGAFALGLTHLATGLGGFSSPARAKTPMRPVVKISCENRHLAERATATIEGTDGQPVTVDSDLEVREYRDDSGEVHHHTHTYLRDHPDEVRESVA